MLPKRWATTRALLGKVVDIAVATRADVKTWTDGADLDDGLKGALHDDSRKLADGMCATLADARAHYAADGGYANDLAFVLLSEEGDRPCLNVAMAKPYVTEAKRRSLATRAWSPREAPAMIDGRESAYLSDGTGFVVHARSRVTVIGHRYSDPDGTTACRVRGAADTGWLPCTALVRQPALGDR